MSKLHLTGKIEYNDRHIPFAFDLHLNTIILASAMLDAINISHALSDLESLITLAGEILLHPDDQFEALAGLVEPESTAPIQDQNPQPLGIRLNEMDGLFTGEEAHDWQIIADRFPDLFDDAKEKIPAMPAPPRSHADIKKMADNGDGLEQDLERLLALPREDLQKSTGMVNASEVARQLGRNTGGSDWTYIQVVAAHLQAAWDEQDLVEAA